MEKGICGVLVLSGLLCLSSSSHYRRGYRFINSPQTWLNAQKYCRDTYTDLATVSDWSETYTLFGLMTASVQIVFIGLYRNWGWSQADVADYEQATLNYSNWDSAPGWQMFCGIMLGTTGKWVATDCSYSYNFFCYNEAATDISERFTLVTTLETWDVAQNYCRSLYTDLAKVRDPLENAQLQMMLNGGQAWIGLTGLLWLWSDGSIPSFAPWKPQEPMLGGVAECTALDFADTSFGLLDANCNAQNTFFCYIAPETKQTSVRLQLATKDPNADINDPAVIDSILRQMEAILRRTTGSSDLYLTWTKLPEKQPKTQAKDKVC